MRVLDIISRSLLPALAVGTLLASAPLSAQAFNFGPSVGVCSNWGDRGPVGQVGDLVWYGARKLDVPSYRTCWDDAPPPTGYVGAPVLALGTETMTVQSATWSPFNLQSLNIGSGWLKGITITFKGYLDVGVLAAPPQQRVVNAVATLSDQFWLLNSGPIRYFTLDVDWGLGSMPAWTDLNAPPPAWANDPFNSRILKRDADRYAFESQGIGTGPDGMPYQTYFVSDYVTGASTVPEPSTWALMATGLAGLAFAARRRRKS